MEVADQLMSIEQCAKFAGVSIDTVGQYAEFGLLPSVEMQGSRFFKEQDVRSVFHLSSNQKLQAKPAVENLAENPSDEQVQQPITLAEQITVIPLSQEIEVTASPKESSRGESLRIIELLQLSQTLREQLEMVKEERDWLRTRLERLEARSEREQMLLLSESETVRSLISQRSDKKRSFWNVALPWNNS